MHFDQRSWPELLRNYPIELRTIEEVSSPETFPLADRNRLHCEIVCADSPVALAAGQRIADRIRSETGVAVEVTPVSSPAREQQSATVRILLGNVSTNPELAALYHAFLCPVDESFPGPDGAYVRTFANPWSDGVDVVIVGASRNSDLDAAVDLLEPHLVGVGDYLAVRRIHEVRISKEFRRRHPDVAFDPDDESYREFPSEALRAYRTRQHRGMAPYLNFLAMMYQLTGDSGFARQYKAIFQDMVAEVAAWEPDQWGRWGFDADFSAVGMVSGWHTIADCPEFTDEDRRHISAHMLAYLGNSEEQWVMHRETASYPARHNHFTFAALGLLFGAMTLGRRHAPELAERWIAMADECFAPQLEATKSTEDCDSYGWLTLTHTLRYALVRPWPAYFDDGWCQATLERGITAMDNMGCQVPHGDSSRYDGTFSELPFWRAAAWKLGNGAFTALVAKKEAVASPVSPLMSIDPPAYDYGASTWPRQDETLDTKRVDVQPLDAAYVATAKDPAPSDGFDKLAFREGFGDNDPYLLIDGVGNGGHGHQDAGAIVRLTSRGRIWLEDADYDKISANFHNTVLISRDGQTTPRPPYARLKSTHETDDYSQATVVIPDLAGCEWTRSVISVPGKGFVVIDRVRAEESGTYDIQCLWRTVGKTTVDSSGWTIAMGSEHLRIATSQPMHSEEFFEPYCRTNWPDYPYAEAGVSVLRQTLVATLGAGESRTIVNVLTDQPASVVNTDGFARATIGNTAITITSDDEVTLRGRANRAGPASGSRGDTGMQDCESSGGVDTGVVSTTTTTRSDHHLDTGAAGSALFVWPLRPQWTFTKPGIAAVLVSDDGIILGGADGGIEAYRGAEKLWSAPTKSGVTALGRSGTGIIVGQRDGVLEFFDAAGKPQWQQTFSPHMGHQATVRAAFGAQLDADGPPSVIIATESCHVEAFTAEGEFRWRYEVVHAATSACAADLDSDGRDEILAATEYWSWHCVGADGSARFKVRGIDGSGASAVASCGSLALFGGWDGHLTAYRPNGDRAWDLAFGDVVTAIVAVDTDVFTTVFTTTRSGYVYRVAADGSIRWHRRLGSAISGCVWSADVLAVVTGDEIRWFDGDGSEVGTLQWSSTIIDIAPCRWIGLAGLYIRDRGDGHSWVANPV